MVGKLWYPAFADVTPAKIQITEGMDADGKPVVVLEWEGLCNYSEKERTITDRDGRSIRLGAVLHTGHDIAATRYGRSVYGEAPYGSRPTVSGTVEICGRVWHIYHASRPRNPDGTVNHTRLELM